MYGIRKTPHSATSRHRFHATLNLHKTNAARRHKPAPRGGHGASPAMAIDQRADRWGILRDNIRATKQGVQPVRNVPIAPGEVKHDVEELLRLGPLPALARRRRRRQQGGQVLRVRWLGPNGEGRHLGAGVLALRCVRHHPVLRHGCGRRRDAEWGRGGPGRSGS